MAFKLICFVFIFKCLYHSSHCARILASVPTPSYSHQIAFRPIWKELAKRGHEIVLLTTDPMENTKNIKQIDLSFSYQILNQNNFSSVLTKKVSNNPTMLITTFMNLFMDILFKQIEHAEVQELIMNQNETFDILMIEMIFPVHLGLAEKFKAPVIALTSMEASSDLHYAMGNDAHSVLYPETTVTPYIYPLTLLQRVLSTISRILLRGMLEFLIVPSIELRMKEVYGNNCRPLKELFENIDMLFSNTNPLLHPVRALTPNTVTFGGGIHLANNNSEILPKDLQIFLDNATNGFVYVSLGTNVKSNSLNDELKQVFLDTFSSLSYKVLWKFETEHITIKSNNIMIKKWIPQREVLKHPHIKLFVTQCGLQSTEEAIFSHVPMVALPFVADQQTNAYAIERHGCGIHLHHSTLTKEVFKESIEEVIRNPKFKKKTKEVADILTDAEMTGLEKVVWWTEYVIRNNGAKYLKLPIHKSPSYQYYLLDVIALVTFVIAIFLFGAWKIVLVCYRKLSIFNRLQLVS